MTPQVHTKNRLVLPQPHPDCAACAKIMDGLDRAIVDGARQRLRLRTLEELVRKESPDVYADYRARVDAGDPWVVGARGTATDVTVRGPNVYDGTEELGGPEGGQHAI